MLIDNAGRRVGDNPLHGDVVLSRISRERGDSFGSFTVGAHLEGFHGIDVSGTVQALHTRVVLIYVVHRSENLLLDSLGRHIGVAVF